MSEVVSILSHQYLKERRNIQLEPFLKYANDAIDKIGVKHISIDDCVTFLYAFCKCGLVDYENVATSQIYHALVSKLVHTSLSSHNIVPALWSLCYLEHPGAEMPNPYIAQLFCEC